MKRPVWLSIVSVGLLMWLAEAAPALLNPDVNDAGDLTPPHLEGCSGPGRWQGTWSPKISGAASEVRSSYRCDGHSMHVYVGRYLIQSDGAEALSDAQRVVPEVWIKHSRSSLTEAGAGFNVNQHHLTAGDQEILIWSWYAIGTRRFQSKWSAKLAEVFNAVLLRPQPAAIFAVGVEAGLNGEQMAHGTSQIWTWYLDHTRDAEGG